MKIYYPILLVVLVLGGCTTVPMASNIPIVRVQESDNGNSNPAADNSTEQQIRVAIEVRQSSVHLVAPEDFTLSGFPWSTPVVQKGEKRYREVTLTSDKLYAHNAYIQPLGEGEIEVNGRKFRGAVEIIEEPRGTLTVINELPLEDYVMGVLAGEVPRNWPLEALKAQAIAARTFAVLKRSEARQRGDSYDLENTAFFQKYNGSELVNDNIRKAVSSTKQEIVTYGSLPILAFFHSNCGGSTSGAEDVWSKSQPYLQPVDCPYGNNGEHFRWKAEVLISDLVRKLRGAGLKIADIVRLEPISRDEGHRILELSVMDSDGSRKNIKGSVFRMAVGPDLIRSTRFDTQIGRDKVVFNGRGWGHGVGLCQEGACGMALKGYNAFEILRYYYHGIMVEKIRE